MARTIFLSLPALVALVAGVDHQPDVPEADLAKDSECEDGECALNAIQLQKSAMNRSVEMDGANSSEIPRFGYHHWATTTMHGDAPRSACGGINTGELVRGTPYYNVASAQAMWRDCGGTGNCWCGKSGGGGGTAGMGCFTCGRGRFLRSSYGTRGKALWSLEQETAETSEGSDSDETSPFASEEVTVIVGDLCPHAGNEDWCPQRAGQRNAYGSYHHLDFSHYPHSIDTRRGVPNLNFVFNMVECPRDLWDRHWRMSQCR